MWFKAFQKAQSAKGWHLKSSQEKHEIIVADS